MASVTNRYQNLGGVRIQDYNDIISNPAFTANEVSEYNTALSPTGYTNHQNVSSYLDRNNNTVNTQTTQVVNNMPQVMSSSNSYASLAENYGHHSSLCDGVQSVIGSLGGAIDSAYSGIHDAFNAVDALMTGALASFTAAFNVLS